MVEVSPSNALRWGFLNEERWLQVNCGVIATSSHLHTVRLHRSFGPIFTEHKFTWPELAVIGKLKDSTVPGCHGLALLWSQNCHLIQAPITENGSGFQIQVKFRSGEFTRVLQMYGPGPSLHFFRSLLFSRFPPLVAKDGRRLGGRGGQMI